MLAFALQIPSSMNTNQPFETVNLNDLSSVIGGANGDSPSSACDYLVDNLKTTIHDSYPKDSHDYAQKRMDSFRPALSAMRETCLQRQLSDGDAPTRMPGRD